MNKSYSELIKIDSYVERYRYLKLKGVVGESTFGFSRFLNQMIYTSSRWKRLRNSIIIRDNGCDMAHDDRTITDRIIVHHINPITEDDVFNDSPLIWDPENLICVSFDTHQAIHYGDEHLLPIEVEERFANDQTPWKNQNGRRN